MDRETQFLAATALIVLGLYALIYSATLSVPYRMPVVVGGFWSLVAMWGALLFRIRDTPLIAFPAAFVILCVLLPTISTALNWSAALITRLLS